MPTRILSLPPTPPTTPKLANPGDSPLPLPPFDPCEVAPDHWRHIHNRLAGREAPRGYSPARHRAWLQRKALLP